jgi:hypothetical protein
MSNLLPFLNGFLTPLPRLPAGGRSLRQVVEDLFPRGRRLPGKGEVRRLVLDALVDETVRAALLQRSVALKEVEVRERGLATRRRGLEQSEAWLARRVAAFDRVLEAVKAYMDWHEGLLPVDNLADVFKRMEAAYRSWEALERLPAEPLEEW